jgi:ubiquinone biosynthesis protein
VPGRLPGRERHVLPDPDGTVPEPGWLAGLEQARRWSAERAGAMTATDLRSLPRGAGVAARLALIALLGAARGVDVAAPRLRNLLGGLGPTFIKLGQLISGGAGLFPDRLIEEFTGFRDRMPAEDFDHVRRVLNEELPGGEAAFAWLDPVPLAAASIAQVHAATLHDGREVVIKVQRPDVARRIESDLAWLATAANLLDRYVPPARTGNLPGIIGYFADTLAEELDFRLEAENMLDVAEAVARSAEAGGVAVPRPHAALVTRRVLVMERLHGFDSTDHEGIAAAGIDTEAMLRAGFLAFVEGAMVHGVFHGDLHPGNIMVLADGRYGILDYGIVGRLSRVERSAFARVMACGAAGDTLGQLRAFADLGAFPPGTDLEALVDVFPSEALGGVPDFAAIAASMRESLQVLVRHHFRLPKLLVLLSKNLIFSEDAVRRFAPDLDLMGEAGPLFLLAAQADAEKPSTIPPMT